MSVVPTSDGDDDGVVWLQCPSCKGFLPKVSSSAAFGGDDASAETADDAVEPVASGSSAESESSTDPDSTTEATDDAALDAPVDTSDPAPEPEAPDPLDDMDISQAVPYRPWASYAEGDVIHHLAWDDYGVVTAKETLPGNRKIVLVRFAEAGSVRLIEQEGDGP